MVLNLNRTNIQNIMKSTETKAKEEFLHAPNKRAVFTGSEYGRKVNESNSPNARRAEQNAWPSYLTPIKQNHEIEKVLTKGF
jgi:hypothetical protein